MYKLQINDYIDRHFEEMLEELKKLIRIDSKRGEAKEGMPFGEGPAEVLKHTEKLLKGYGFNTVNHENYVLTADLNDMKNSLDILAHLDVVPEGADWTKCSPFEPVIDEGRIYGRGTADDKGPAIAAIFAMRAVKELGIPMKKGVRLILGADEECGSSDLEYYYSKHEEAEMSFTPDANFPVVNTEKGRLETDLRWKNKGEAVPQKAVVSLNAGVKANVIPGVATMVVKGLSEDEINAAVKESGLDSKMKFTLTDKNGDIEIEARGVYGHAAFPEGSVNALSGLLMLVKYLPLDKFEGHEKLKALSEFFPLGGYYGEALNVNMEDEVSGKLTISLTMLDYDGEKLSGDFDCRAPISANDENLTDVVLKNLRGAGFELDDVKMAEGHHVPADSFFVKTLLETYGDHFEGPAEATCTGGGTYVHHLKNGVAFGCEIEGVDNHMHGPDEFMDLEVLRKSAKVFADAMVRLCGDLN